MISIDVESVVSQKSVPYDLYDESGAKVVEAGEILTPGKIVEIREHKQLFKKEEEAKPEAKAEAKTEQKPEAKPAEAKADEAKADEAKAEGEEEDVEGASFVNPKCKFDFETQIDYKRNYAKALGHFNQNEVQKFKTIVVELRDRILKDVQIIKKNVQYYSEIKLIGDHKVSHPINTAILATFLATKLEYSESQIMEIVLAALLHDIGKIKLVGEITDMSKMNNDEVLAYKKHPIIGHRIVRAELNLSENIARVALQHHEKMDGSGWPYGISSTMISDYAQIIAVCDCFDNMTSAQTNLEILNFREALRSLLKMGGRVFSPKPLYAFIHMFNYGDTTTFEELKS